MTSKVITPRNIPQRLREMRLSYGYKQETIAKIMNVSRVSYGKYENPELHIYPDAQQISDFICHINKEHGETESADYLLGLSDTRNYEYAKAADVTGLNQEALEYLEKEATLDQKSVLNHLLCEESIPYPLLEPPAECYAEFDAEKAYEQHLSYEKWNQENVNKSILEHLGNNWTYQDQGTSETYEEALAKNLAEDNNGHQYENMEAPKFNKFEHQARLQKYWDYNEKENHKSNLLSAITNYLNYQSGCYLYTPMKSEQLTDNHCIEIGYSPNNTIKFPSQNGDKYIERMLIDDVIDALKSFKNNYYKKTEK